MKLRSAGAFGTFLYLLAALAACSDGDAQTDGGVVPSSCRNGTKDADEAALDCGGRCPPCAAGKACTAAFDCDSSVCSGGACAAPTCQDQVRNGAETDLDCGGSCPACASGSPCRGADDCQTGMCVQGACVGGSAPVYDFVSSGTTASETQTMPLVITVSRMGNLTVAGSVRVVIGTGATAAQGIHYDLAAGSTFGTLGYQSVYFPAQAAGATMQTMDVQITPKRAFELTGTTKTVDLVLESPMGGMLASASPKHTVSFSGSVAPLMTFQGMPVPESFPVGTYASQGAACEFPGFTPMPGFGNQSPCGSYGLDPAGVALCNKDMDNTVTPYGSGQSVTDSVLSAYLFVSEDLKLGNTYFYGNDLRFPQDKNAAFMVKFKTGGAGEFPVVAGLPPGVLGRMTFGFGHQNNRGEAASRFATLSRGPCDFDYTKYDPPTSDPCYRVIGAMVGTLIVDIAPAGVAPTPGTCRLLPNTTYYLNMRWEDPGLKPLPTSPDPPTRGRITCKPSAGSPTGQNCGTSLAFN